MQVKGIYCYYPEARRGPIELRRKQQMTETETRAALESTKIRKFRALVRHANAHAPYYANIIRERGIDLHSCTPADFPVLTKSLLMANFNDILTDPRVTKQVVADFLNRSTDPKELLFDELTVIHTSGTSGEVGYFLYAPADHARLRASAMRNRKVFRSLFPRLRLRLRPRRFRVAFYGATGGHFAGVTGIASMQRGLRRLFLNAQAFEVNTPLPDVVQRINQFQPDMLWGYTTALKMLGDEQRAGRLKIKPLAVAATGEMVTTADMQFLSAAFGGASASSIYACTEHMMLGISNPGADTMTLMDDDLVFEFYADHSIITNLYNFTMPLIRYRMADILRPVSPPDARRIVIENLVGRTEQMPLFTNSAGAKDFISPHTINEIFVEGVTRFQMQITGPSSFRFPICVEAALDGDRRALASAGVSARLTAILQQKGLGNVTFEVPIVADIPLNERTRKFQLIVAQPAG
jgi:phenylacetate-coenzyme A ligase PaaK-like adenylate-forming protein